MRTLQLILIASYCMIGSFSFGQNSEIREVDPFTKIKILDNAKVELSIGSPQSVRVETRAMLGAIKTIVSDGTLSIQGPEAIVYITAPEINGINISGIGKLNCDSILRSSFLRISISGNGKVKIPVDVGHLEIGISGIGKIELGGRADHTEINVSGSGKIEAYQLEIKSCEANISGVGKCYADVKESLLLRISGSGSFYYKTKPSSFSANISGIGKYGIYNDDTSSMPNDSTSENKTFTVIGHQDDNDDYAFKWETDSIFRTPQKARSHWSGIDIGFNQLMVGNKFSTDLPDTYDYLELNSGKSININLNLFYHDFQLYKRTVMFTTGLGMTLNNYRFSSNKTIVADTNRIVGGLDYTDAGELIKYDKNKLAVNYVTVPALIQFNTRQEFKKSLHVGVGMLFSYKYGSHLKLVYNDDGERKKLKRRDEFYIQPFRTDATIRIGYEYYTLYATYALNSLFKDNKGPQLHPFQIGINLAGW